MFRVLATILGAFAVGLGALAFGIAAAALLARYLPITHEVVLVLAAASPYLTPLAVVAMVLFAVARRWVLTIVAACLAMVMLAVLAPRYIGPDEVGAPSVALRVVTANLGLGQADPRAVVALADVAADVLVVEEMTPQVAAAMSAAGLDAGFPHRVLDPQPMAAGIGVWSRHPIVASAPIGGYQMPMLRARITVPGVRFDTTVLAVHLAAPWVQPLRWFRGDIERLPSTLRALARDAGPGAVIVAGDLNATYDMRPFRALLDEGYRDAAEQAGAGLTRSYPSRPWRPPVVGIDHVLVRNAVATSAQTVAVSGSDHRGLFAVVDIPVDPTTG
ncbi:endonuclease/exonuclease/phosphatase family protein [Mycobacterium sp. IDR2000157661]|uniref:endonuclease/exonuclease/phosphatase family protein n=1 Tax=Mycobacterium sp. IDR2000157661 TaxID=2867005 RepID=UPI001EE9DF24|nr:endonuclease/exonuclease/phosphatase family protein [Mycobacterium sp. IDR2000157661]ULE34297.1 endonuclease/exonuclease/phosphatase family protein [Mycobacterium sp. IDR2000157661]